MRVQVLLENTASRPDLTAEHGLSLYIETKGQCILFDAGQSDAFAANAEKMGVELSRVDFAVLSHGHYDHGGGLGRFLELNSTAPVYVNQNAFGAHHNGSGKYIGLDHALLDSGRLVFTGDSHVLSEGVTLHTCNSLSRPFPTDPFGLTVQTDGQRLPESFLHEQYLLIEEDGKRYLFSGCSHKGILNIVHWFRPDVLIGGFHFKQLDPIADAARLEDAARLLLESPTVYYTGHCTGQDQYAFLKARMGHRLQGLATGDVLFP